MPTSLQVKTSIKDSLIRRSEVTSTERCHANLDEFIDEALIEYSEEDTADFAPLHVLEQRMIVWLAWITVCYARASGFAPQPSQKPGSNVGYGFGTDRDTPYKKCMDMAAKLKEEYSDMKAEYDSKFGDDDEDSESSTGDVFVGSLLKTEAELGAFVPPQKASSVAIRNFDTVSVGAGFAILGWSRTTSTAFVQLFIFKSSASGIVEKWNADGNSGVPFIAAAASKIYGTTDFISKQIKVTGLTAGTHYFVLVTVSLNGLYWYSDQITAVVP